jgi:hypothetical protein
MLSPAVPTVVTLLLPGELPCVRLAASSVGRDVVLETLGEEQALGARPIRSLLLIGMRSTLSELVRLP